MWKKINALLTSVITVLLFITGCSLGEDADIPQTEYPKALPEASLDGISAVLDDSIIYSVFNEQNIDYFRFCYDTNEIVKIGAVEKYILGQGYEVLIGDYLYFYATQAESEAAVFLNDEYTNILYAINLADNSLNVISENTEYLPGAFTCACGNDLAVAQSKRNPDGSVTSFLEIIDTGTYERKAKSEEFVYAEENITESDGGYLLDAKGQNITIISTFQNKVYAQIYDADHDSFLIKEYDDELNLLRTIDANAALEKEAAKGGDAEQRGCYGIWRFKVYSEFAFLYNGFGNGLFGIM